MRATRRLRALALTYLSDEPMDSGIYDSSPQSASSLSRRKSISTHVSAIEGEAELLQVGPIRRGCPQAAIWMARKSRFRQQPGSPWQWEPTMGYVLRELTGRASDDPTIVADE